MRDDALRMLAADTAPREMLWLLGQPQLSDYLEFVKDEVVGGEDISPRQLADEWRAANNRYYDLEEQEAGIADGVERLPLDPRLAPLVDALMASPHYRNTFDTLPMSVEMVELDRLIVSQPFIAGGFAEERARSLGTHPSPEALFHYCLPVERALPAVTVERNGRGDFRISSFSTDLRHHEPRLLTAAETSSLTSYGPIAAVIGLIVGFGSNFLTAIGSDTRLLLHNGYHRAYSLRALGITHAPCLIETVTRKDELRLAAAEPVAADPAFYFRAGRPPLLKDYFDPLLTRRFAVRPKRMVVDVELKVRKSYAIETAPSPLGGEAGNPALRG